MVDKDKLARDLYNHFHYGDDHYDDHDIIHYVSLDRVIHFIQMYPDTESSDISTHEGKNRTAEIELFNVGNGDRVKLNDSGQIIYEREVKL